MFSEKKHRYNLNEYKGLSIMKTEYLIRALEILKLLLEIVLVIIR